MRYSHVLAGGRRMHFLRNFLILLAVTYLVERVLAQPEDDGGKTLRKHVCTAVIREFWSGTFNNQSQASENMSYGGED